MSILEIYRKLRAGYQGSQKRIFDAEHFFFRWYRPISFFPSAVFISRGVSANAVTGIGAACLLTAFVLLAAGYLLAGAFLYLLAYLLDFVDGNIARYVGEPTYFGKMIDGLVDSLTFLLFIALGIGNACSGHAMFGTAAEMFLGIATAFGFLFRAYFYVRVTFVLSQELAPATKANEMAGAATHQSEDKLTAIHPARPKLLQWGKKVYFGIISGMPVLLLLAVLLDGISIYLGAYFVLFVLATLFEVWYGLKRVWAKDASSRELL